MIFITRFMNSFLHQASFATGYWYYDRHRSVRLVILVGLAIDQIAQSGLSSLSVIYYSAHLFRGDQQSSHVSKSEVEDHLKTPTQNKTPTRKDVKLDLARCSDEIYAYLRVLDVSRDTPGLDYLFIDALDDLEQQVEACLIDRADETKISQAIMVSNPSMPAKQAHF